jgi:hypothetical protein
MNFTPLAEFPTQDQVNDLKAQLAQESGAAEDARRAAEASAAEAAAARASASNEVAAWQAKMTERKKVRGPFPMPERVDGGWPPPS